MREESSTDCLRESEIAEVKSDGRHSNVLSGALIAHKHGFGVGNVQDKSTSATSRIQTEDPASESNNTKKKGAHC